MIKGSCCCGVVQFELAEQPVMMGTCHCSRCRKVGASNLVFVKSEYFRLVSGRDQISVFKAIPPYKYDRCFCSACGTALGEILSEEESFPLAANCIDGDIGLENQFHEFVSEKPAWLEIGDTARQFDEHPIEP
ncbi:MULTISPECIES: GFA family protein [unclassified Microbulbifer]|uniref:GFA family protein n=1 Tax=unclassified Microbulbifer TaxID=2619833 RepID=UPI001E5929A0|nr:GFA family protein [Microbulbifer sp. YPW16]UHQ54594.1 GFA family protein [Microbulbifer sp. YPW16]